MSIPTSKSGRGASTAGFLAAAAAMLLSAGGASEQTAYAQSTADAAPTIVPAPAYAEPYGPPGGGAAHDAAIAFRETLSEEQLRVLALPIDSPLRGNWSNLPATRVDFDHNGVRLGDMTAEQLRHAFDFLAAALGPHGYGTVTEVVAAEAVLGESLWARLSGLSEGNYWLAFFGEPTLTGTWGWQFGGHHLAVNGSFGGGKATGLSPTFVGVEPATFTMAGHQAEPLSGELAAGRAVMRALPTALQTEAAIDDSGMEAGAGKDGRIPRVRGSAVANWPGEARALLLDAILHWVALQPPENAAWRMAELESTLDELHFAWGGAIEGGIDDVYFRIHGPTLIIEFSVEDGGDNPHFHSVYRDPTNEYGRGSR